MARFNEILVGRYNRYLQKLLSMKGGPPSAQLSTEITANLQLFHGIETRYLEGWNRFGQEQAVLAGGAGNVGQVRIRNPGTSNVIGVIEKIIIANINAGTEQPTVFQGVQPADLTTIVTLTNARFDPRGNPTPTLIMSSKSNSVLTTYGSNRAVYGMTTNTNVDVIVFEDHEITLLPGDALDVANGVANQALGVTFWWRERFLEDSERT
jgi:hypothetical protein